MQYKSVLSWLFSGLRILDAYFTEVTVSFKCQLLFCFVLLLENAEMKFKDFILSLKTMIFSEDEALCVVDLLKEKSGVIQDALKRVSIFLVMSICGSR